MTKMFQKFEFPAWSCQIFTKEIKIPENQIRHHFRIHLGNPLCILLLTILGQSHQNSFIIAFKLSNRCCWLLEHHEVFEHANSLKNAYSEDTRPGGSSHTWPCTRGTFTSLQTSQV